MEKLWNTYYIYHPDDADRLLKEVVDPAVQNLQEVLTEEVKFFFIRYFENGYHIRLRLLLSAEKAKVFLLILKDHISVYEQRNGVFLELKEAEYIPETERYGNENTIAHAENQFCASSQFVLHHLTQNSPLTASERYLLAMKTHFAFFKGMRLSQEYSRELCEKFVQSWLPLPISDNPDEHEQNSKDLWSVFQRQFESYQPLLYENIVMFWNSLDATTDLFTKQFLKENHKIWQEYVQSKLPLKALEEALLSFIHMTNNRWGIINAEESYLLFLIMRTLPLIKDYDNKSRT
ncbi:thiopeptide-type bacteriocin biosynthesis protein [Chryseobacterium sp. 52]|uniref:thiopeptide-type bacteriocin biosynthesis protein n=1 Tax=Chryseobacterium sp. 52 TaxID=2035213 RepID=UPI000C1769E7|nr:thiopeptide-type bacteriocin biosynthesis protein [Chryseobacterium sp. 52]PIF46308.1 thiopeptide-type bacteriocin biosynthesis protein [Chryseobacterium sp. 52]